MLLTPHRSFSPVVVSTNALVAQPQEGARLATALRLLRSACKILSSGYNTQVLEAAGAGGAGPPVHLITEMLRAIEPALTGVFTHWGAVEDITTKASDLLRDACKAGEEAIQPFMVKLIGEQAGAGDTGLLVTSFAAGGNAALLDLFAVLLTLFGGPNPTRPELLLQLVQQVSGHVFQKFAAAPADHATMMERYFEMIRKFLRNTGQVLTVSKNAHALLKNYDYARGVQYIY